MTPPSAGEMNVAAAKSNRRGAVRVLRLTAGLAITVLCFVYIFRSADIAALRAALAEFDWRYSVLALAFLSAGYALRIYRWAVMLRISAPHVSARACAAPYLASIALNNLLPFRSGDILRAFVFPKGLGISRSQSLATLAFERLTDLVMVVAILGVGINAIGSDMAPPWLTSSLAALLALCAAGAILAFFGHRLVRNLIKRIERVNFIDENRLFHALLAFADNAFSYVAALTRNSRLAGVVFLTAAVWGMEAAVFAAVMAGLGDPVSLTGVALIAGLATIATLAPSSPGYFGPFHLAAFESYQILFGEPGRAAAMAVLSHAAIWAPTTIAGLIALAVGWRRFGASTLHNTG